jgi:hypothetical protein
MLRVQKARWLEQTCAVDCASVRCHRRAYLKMEIGGSRCHGNEAHSRNMTQKHAVASPHLTWSPLSACICAMDSNISRGVCRILKGSSLVTDADEEVGNVVPVSL